MFSFCGSSKRFVFVLRDKKEISERGRKKFFLKQNFCSNNKVVQVIRNSSNMPSWRNIVLNKIFSVKKVYGEANERKHIFGKNIRKLLADQLNQCGAEWLTMNEFLFFFFFWYKCICCNSKARYVQQKNLSFSFQGKSVSTYAFIFLLLVKTVRGVISPKNIGIKWKLGVLYR